MIVEPVTEENRKAVNEFLLNRDATSIFLLGNLYDLGPRLTEHVNSGNFKLIKKDGKIICVFCLSKRGNLLSQSSPDKTVFDLIIQSCKEEPITIRGYIGDWDLSQKMWSFLKEKGIIHKDTYCSKQVNYELSIIDRPLQSYKEARILQTADYQPWERLRNFYLEEQGLPDDLNEEERKMEFLGKCSQKMIWGVFEKGKLISIGELNAKTDSLATVGGVFTIPEMRRQGYGTRLMEQLIYDCKNTLGLQKLIIFTGVDENKPAQALYESLGCKKVGYMALLFGE